MAHPLGAVVPAAFGRLCVETPFGNGDGEPDWPAAFGRLCVETVSVLKETRFAIPAAFGRLCVETEAVVLNQEYERYQPPSGGCVLKQSLR